MISKFCANNACIDVVFADGRVEIRNTTKPDVVVITTPIEWAAFAVGIKNGDFDALGAAGERDEP